VSTPPAPRPIADDLTHSGHPGPRGKALKMGTDLFVVPKGAKIKFPGER